MKFERFKLKAFLVSATDSKRRRLLNQSKFFMSF